jgi:DNA-binding transcriptional LysR family regulator
MNWDDLRVFLAAARRGSHKGAGKQLGVDPTTVSRRLQALERALAAKLFQRTPEALTLTSAGAALLRRAENVEAELLAGERELGKSDERVDGQLRVTAGDGLVHYVLVPALGGLRRQHPELQLELRADTAELDLSRREADVALRFGRPKQPALVARRLAQVEFGLYASDGYLARAGQPRGVSSLADHELIGFESALDSTPQVRWLTSQVPQIRYALRANTTTAQVRAAADGLGIALLTSYVAAREPRLRRVLTQTVGISRDLWFVTHRDLRHLARVMAFRRFVEGLLV